MKIAGIPQYKNGRKAVGALKIKKVRRRRSGDIALDVHEDEFSPVLLRKEFAREHKPRPGGYFTLDNAGNRGFVGARDFQESHTPISQ